MKIKLSATFEGKCDICGREGIVFSAGDEDTGRVVTVCKDCSEKHGEEKTSEIIEKYGHVEKSAFDDGIKVERKTEAG